MPPAKKTVVPKIRQILPNPKYPNVAVPVVVDDDEYSLQLGVYEARCKKAQKEMDEAERVRQEEEERRRVERTKAKGKAKVGSVAKVSGSISRPS